MISGWSRRSSSSSSINCVVRRQNVVPRSPSEHAPDALPNAGHACSGELAPISAVSVTQLHHLEQQQQQQQLLANTHTCSDSEIETQRSSIAHGDLHQPIQQLIDRRTRTKTIDPKPCTKLDLVSARVNGGRNRWQNKHMHTAAHSLCGLNFKHKYRHEADWPYFHTARTTARNVTQTCSRWQVPRYWWHRS